jgi:hypothetical protein
MRPDDADRDLRRAFAALREDDRRRTPDFERLTMRTTRPRPAAAAAWRVLLATGAAAVLVLAALWWWPSSNVETPLPGGAASLVAWRAPTDVLLQTPGSALLAEIPDVGGSGFLTLPTPSSAGRTKNGSVESPSRRKEPTP